MFDAQITVALFATFLLGMVVGSGMEIIVRGWRRGLTTVSADMLSMPQLLRDAEALAVRPSDFRQGSLICVARKHLRLGARRLACDAFGRPRALISLQIKASRLWTVMFL
jgi:hypothetical protein